MVFPYTSEGNCNELSECFRQTKRIKWNLGPLVSSIHTDHMEGAFNQFVNERGFQINRENDFSDRSYVCVWLPKEIARAYQYEYVWSFCLSADLLI